MVIPDASRGDILHADPAECEQGGTCDLSLVADANAPVPGLQPDIGLRHRRPRDGRTTPKQGATSRNTAASSGSQPYMVIPVAGAAGKDAGAADPACRPLFAPARCRSCPQSRPRGVAGAYPVFDTPDMRRRQRYGLTAA